MIKSSFKKVEKKGADSNTAFFGHPELDAILNNTLKKGHLVVIEEDHPTTIFVSLLRCAIGSQYHKGHHSIVFDSLVADRWKSIVPVEAKERLSERSDKAKGQKSQIAWRYDNMKINLDSLSLNSAISWMDLSKNVGAETAGNLVSTFAYGQLKLKELYQKVQAEVMNTLKDSNDTALRKLIVTGLPERYFEDQDFEQFVHSLRCLARTSHLLVLLTVRPVDPNQKNLLDSLVSYSDYYLKISSDLGQAYSHFDGTLAVIKQIPVGTSDLSERGITVWGIKSRSKRELTIHPLYQNVLQDQPQKQEHPCGVSSKQRLQF